jgi:hypothetical protein
MALMVAVTCALEMVVRLVSDSSAPASAPPSAVPTVPNQPSSKRDSARVACQGRRGGGKEGDYVGYQFTEA